MNHKHIRANRVDHLTGKSWVESSAFIFVAYLSLLAIKMLRGKHMRREGSPKPT